jgi:hypothetical protein
MNESWDLAILREELSFYHNTPSVNKKSYGDLTIV